ncbi:MAG: YqhA family protein [Gammaproteobacteria bacterium]|nr:YqhA family protein [Gammaproteobacteria bacterium]MDH5803215.1 YqhA family protein [Gammaproteobacteria bacterium]
MSQFASKCESIFEGMLWRSRFIVLFAVIASLFCSLTMFYMATVDAFYTVVHFVQYADPSIQGNSRTELRSQTITHIVEIVDGYLLATVLLIFALGLYELFISRIDAAEKSETASNVLIINSLDDLKARLAKVILMILIVRFFEFAIRMQFKDSLDLLYLAAGIALIGLALFLSHESDKRAH